MIFNGLFLEDVVEKDKPKLIMAGVILFSLSSILWLWAMCIFGAIREDEPVHARRKLKFFVGFICLVAILGLMFGAASLLPKKVTVESVATDHTISDEEAIFKMAKILFPKQAYLATSSILPELVLSLIFYKNTRPNWKSR